MQDLLREINKLSARINESNLDDSSSSKDGTTNTTGSKRLSRKRQKGRIKKKQGRKRQLKHVPDFGAESSSFTDCTDEEVIKDYIENLTSNLSGSDGEGALRKGAFLVKQDFDNCQVFKTPWSPEIAESDSFSESLFLNNARKKRRKHRKNNSLVDVSVLPRAGLCVDDLAQQLCQPSYKHATGKRRKTKLECLQEMDVVLSGNESGCVPMDLVMKESLQQQCSSVEDSCSSEANTNSPGSEADDEGEDSCLETTHAVVIPWWEHAPDEELADCDVLEEVPPSDPQVAEHSLSILQNRPDLSSRPPRCSFKEPSRLRLKNGCFVAYANHKIRNFLQHRDTNELSLYTTNKKEQSQVMHLAALYSLHYIVEEAPRHSRLVLTKTRNTKEANQEALRIFLTKEVQLRYRKDRSQQWNSKRRRIESMGALAPESPQQEVPIPESNIGSQMLRSMGWLPGRGLGKDSMGILNPVKVVKRPRNLGLGHPTSML